jgi:hypothetical protein
LVNVGENPSVDGSKSVIAMPQLSMKLVCPYRRDITVLLFGIHVLFTTPT